MPQLALSRYQFRLSTVSVLLCLSLLFTGVGAQDRSTEQGEAQIKGAYDVFFFFPGVSKVNSVHLKAEPDLTGLFDPWVVSQCVFRCYPIRGEIGTSFSHDDHHILKKNNRVLGSCRLN
jgi:hypothetical protein